MICLVYTLFFACFSSNDVIVSIDGEVAEFVLDSLEPKDEYPEYTHIRLVGPGTIDHVAPIFPNAEELVFHYTTDITEIPADLPELKQLKRLTILGTNSRRLPASFDALSVESLEVAFHPLLEEVPDLPLVQERLLIHHNPSLSSLPEQLGGQTIKEWNFSNNALRRIPQRIVQYQQLERISIHANRLLSIPKELFALQSVSVLNLYNNPILTIPDVPSQNKIRSLELHNLPNLTAVQSWKSFPDIQTLSIRHTPVLKQLPSDWNLVPKLQSISISSTNLSSISLNLHRLRQLDSLSIRMNRNLRELTGLSLPSSLLYLLIDQNALTALPDHIGLNNRLRIVRLDENRLKSFPKSLCALSSLEEFSVANNPIASFCPNGVQFPVLRVLNLQGTHLRSIPNDILAIPRLEQISLGGDLIKEAPFHLFRHTNLREILYLSTPTPSNIRVMKALKKSLPKHIKWAEL